LLEKRDGVFPRYRNGFHPSDSARLLIGDEALRGALDENLRHEFPVIADLGEEWFRWQGLPFVFARWMVGKNISPEDKLRLSEFLDRNLRADLSSLADGDSAKEY